MRFEREGVVSIWVGAFDSEADLDGYVDWKYDEADEAHCAFASDVGLGWFDHDSQEAQYLAEHPQEPIGALAGHSYSASFVEDAAAAIARLAPSGWNALFLLYDCAYDPERGHPRSGCRLHFIGSFPFSHAAGEGRTQIRTS